MVKRFINRWERLNKVFKARTTNDVLVDEKWFNKMTVGGYMRLPDSISIEQPAEFWRNKSHILKILYFSAIFLPNE